MSAVSDFAASTGPLIGAVLSALRANTEVQAVFGSPARLYDGQASGAYYPYAVLERCESQTSDGVAHRGFEHTLHFAVFSRNAGVEGSKDMLSVLRFAIEQLDLGLTDQKILLILPTYSDVLRTKNPNVLRGVLRVRLRTEEV
ncbi:MAG: DUF3168 domain-containing protein [Pseudomonadota bacterium]